MPVPLAGAFLDTAAAPGDDVRVRSFGWDDGEHTFGPVKWSPIGGQLPQAGDEAVILERDDGIWQVVAWWNDSQDTGVAQSALDTLAADITALEAAVTALDTRIDALENRASGSSSGTITATYQSADVTIPHGLGTTPAAVGFTSKTTLISVALVSKNSTNIVAKVFYTPGVSISGTFNFEWEARA